MEIKTNDIVSFINKSVGNMLLPISDLPVVFVPAMQMVEKYKIASGFEKKQLVVDAVAAYIKSHNGGPEYDVALKMSASIIDNIIYCSNHPFTKKAKSGCCG